MVGGFFNAVLAGRATSGSPACLSEHRMNLLRAVAIRVFIGNRGLGR